MTKFTLAAQNTNNANHVTLFSSATSGQNQVMPGRKPSTHFLKSTIDVETAETLDVNSATIESTNWGAWGHGFSRTNVMENFKENALDAQLINFAMAEAPISNSMTSKVMSILSTPESRKSTLVEVLWRIRTMVDPALGAHTAGFKKAEMDIPTFRGEHIFISSVVIGRMFGLDTIQMVTGKLGKFNHRVGRSNGHRKPWISLLADKDWGTEGEELQSAKVAAWAKHNARPDVLNKFEITTNSVAALADAVHRRLEAQPLRTLDTLNI